MLLKARALKKEALGRIWPHGSIQADSGLEKPPKLWVLVSFSFLFFKDFIYLFLESRGGRKRETHINAWPPLALGTWPATKACALPGNRTGDPWVCRPALNPPSHTSQGMGLGFFTCKMGMITTAPFQVIGRLRGGGRSLTIPDPCPGGQNHVSPWAALGRPCLIQRRH